MAHLPQAKAALERKIPTVVDKPMGRTVAEVQEMIDCAASNNTLLTTFFNRRWDSDSLTIKKVLATGEIGTPFASMDALNVSDQIEIPHRGVRISHLLTAEGCSLISNRI